MRPRRTALLVMPAGALRRALAAALGTLGLDVRPAGEPYGAALALGEAAVDLVVLDLGVVGARDRAFVRALKQRTPRTRLVLLLPEGRRRLAGRLLKAGADAYVLAPTDPDELVHVARALLRDLEPLGDPVALIRLSDEVAHAINNPLQVLSLWAEGGTGTGRGATAPDPAVRETVGRIRDVVGLLSSFGRLAAPARSGVDLVATLDGAFERAGKAKRVLRRGSGGGTPVQAALDPGQVALALDVTFAALAGLAARAPVPCRGRVLASLEVGRPHRLQVLGEGLALAPEQVEALPGLVLASHPDTRLPHPGFALPAAVASLHGGAFRLRSQRRGLLVTLALPS
jgi:CheY-like chemotaxis protein